MIMYTPVPPEILWYEEGKDNIEFREEVIDGIPLQLKVVNGQFSVIERVLSTDPAHFLHLNCQPGRVLNGDCTK